MEEGRTVQFWIIASVIVLVLAAITVALLIHDGRIRPRGQRPVGPDWLIPTPRRIREPRLNVVWQGYEPRQVDALLDAVAAAYEELVLAAGPSAVAQAERRLAERRGVSLPSAQELQDARGDLTRRFDDAPVTDVGEDLDPADGDALL